jgi:hypothetical protein
MLDSPPQRRDRARAANREPGDRDTAAHEDGFEVASGRIEPLRTSRKQQLDLLLLVPPVGPVGEALLPTSPASSSLESGGRS